MSRLAELAYDIEQLYIEGHTPRMIAMILECPIEIVYDWLADANLDAESSTDESNIDAYL